MENLEEMVEIQEQPALVVSEEIRSYLYNMAKWANFLAIIGFIFVGITIIGAFTVGAAMDQNPAVAVMVGQFGSLGKIIFTAIFLVVAFLVFYPSLLLFKYSSKARSGVLYGEQESLNEALAKLSSLFGYWGIMTIICVALYIMAVVSSITTGVAAGQ